MSYRIIAYTLPSTSSGDFPSRGGEGGCIPSLVACRRAVGEGLSAPEEVLRVKDLLLLTVRDDLGATFAYRCPEG